MSKSLTYVEFDAESCSLEYGVSPCQAGAENWFFQSSNEGFSVSNATLTTDTEYSVFTSTASDPQLLSPTSLTIDGSTDFIILLDIERVTTETNWNGRVFYETSGHGFSASFYKEIPDVAVGRHFIRLDMRELTAGGDDWIENEIIRVRFDFSEDSGQTFNVYKIQIHQEQKCFNTLRTCQDRANYDPVTTTIRYAKDTNYLPADIENIPSIVGVEFTPATLKLAESLGERATLNVRFKDHRHSDVGPGYDKYSRERGYDPYDRGTYWGKFRARRPFVRGKDIRLIRGLLGQDISAMDTRHYVVESFNGPTPDGVYTLIAKDVLKFADDDRAQAPRLSQGFLVSGITDSATSATLSPSGIGDIDYPASGKVAIGGEEICSFTRSGDVLTLTRAQNNTVAVAHDAQDRVQLVLEYTAEDPADIIHDLFTTYAGVPSSYINLSAWQTETSSFLNRVYTAVIPEPVGVNKLINELIEQAALIIWWDDMDQLIRLQVLRSISTTAASFTQTNTLENTLRTQEEPNKRISEVWTYYGQRNPLLPLDEKDNYRSALLTIDPEAESDYGSPGIKQIFSRWIAAFGRTTAEQVNDIIISRFRDPPRTFQFSIFRYGDDAIRLGQGYQLSGWNMQDDTGQEAFAPIQITRLNHNESTITVQAEEILITAGDEVDLTNRTIIIDSNINNINMRTIHDDIYPEPTGTESPPVTVTCVINSGVIVGSDSTADPAFDVGSWPSGITLALNVEGRIQGAGGNGGTPTFNGDPGGTALYTTETIDLVLNVGDGEVFGGGGGGGGSASNTGGGAGGGQGQIPGLGAENTLFPGDSGGDGTTEAPGIAPDGVNPVNDGGDGGAAGQDGDDSSSGSFLGGAAGNAIDGISFVTKTGTGDVRGPEVN